MGFSLGKAFGGIARGVGKVAGFVGDVLEVGQVDEIYDWTKKIPGVGDVIGEIEDAVTKNPAAAAGILAFPYAPLAGALGVTFQRRRNRGASIDEAATGAVADTLGMAATAVGIILGGPAGGAAGAGTGALIERAANLASTAAKAEMGEASAQDVADAAASFGQAASSTEAGQRVQRKIADRIETAKESASDAAAAVEGQVDEMRSLGRSAASGLVNEVDERARKVGRAALGDMQGVLEEGRKGLGDAAAGIAQESGLTGDDGLVGQARDAFDSLGEFGGGTRQVGEAVDSVGGAIGGFFSEATGGASDRSSRSSSMSPGTDASGPAQSVGFGATEGLGSSSVRRSSREGSSSYRGNDVPAVGGF